MLHKVELRPESIKGRTHYSATAASLNEDVILDTWILVTTSIFANFWRN